MSNQFWKTSGRYLFKSPPCLAFQLHAASSFDWIPHGAYSLSCAVHYLSSLCFSQMFSIDLLSTSFTLSSLPSLLLIPCNELFILRLMLYTLRFPLLYSLVIFIDVKVLQGLPMMFFSPREGLLFVKQIRAFKVEVLFYLGVASKTDQMINIEEVVCDTQRSQEKRGIPRHWRPHKEVGREPEGRGDCGEEPLLWFL